MKLLKPTHIGLITGGLMILASLFAYHLLHLPIESYFQYVVYSIFLAGVAWSLLSFHQTATAGKKFKDYFSSGFKTFVVVALLMAVFAYIFFSLHTDFRDAKIAENNKLIIAEGNHLPKEIEENDKRLKQLFLPIMVSSAVFRYLIIGALVSAIGAGFLSQKKESEIN